MKVYPDRFKAFTVDGKNCFPMYASTGCLTSRFVAILYRGKPLVLEGGTFGNDEDLHKDDGGSWINVVFWYTDTEADVARKVSEAEEKLDRSL